MQIDKTVHYAIEAQGFYCTLSFLLLPLVSFRRRIPKCFR